MSQWGAGYQYPQQTGFPGGSQFQNPQFQQQNPNFQNPQFGQQNAQFQPGSMASPGGLVPQPTGFPGQRLQGFQQPQQTGFGGPSPGLLQSQPTGFPGSNFQQQGRPPPPPVPPLPSQFQQSNQSSGLLGLGQQQQGNRFLTPSPGPGLMPQRTGFPGGGQMSSLVPQMTGFVDPRVQMMSTTFMPANTSAPYAPGGLPQLPPQQLQGGLNLQQSFQQHNQQRGIATPQVSWTLSKSEKKGYNDIFRAWDTHNTGFISGQTALEVFGQSGLDKEDLARIWALSDINDRGKLNIAEFHVAMGLIYRKLNGVPIPDQLPPEMVPPSVRDLDDSVTRIKSILQDESRSRSPSGVDSPMSLAKGRSFGSSASSLDSGRDGTIYRHDDSESNFYQPRSRHVNRDNVRSRNDEDNPSAELSDMKRRLADTAQMLDRAAEADASRTAEDEELDQEMDDLKYRVKRVNEDLDYVSRGPKSIAKDKERRELERELLSLMHERIPEVERKIKAREERKEREKRQWARDRDRANERFGRYDTTQDSYSSRKYDDRDRPYSRGGYNGDNADRDRDYRRDRSRSRERERERERDRDRDRDRERDRDRDRDQDRARTPPRTQSPSSARSTPVTTSSTLTPSKSSSPGPSIKKMTPEERKAYAQAEAKRMIAARMAALGVTAPSTSPGLDSSVEDRLQQERKEAEEKAKVAERQAEERERSRKERLDGEKALKDGRTTPGAVTPTPTRTTTAAVATPTPKVAPPPPKRAPAPPPPRKIPATRPVVAPRVPSPPPQPKEDPEEIKLREREEAIRKQREARAEKLRQLEREEEEAARRAEERLRSSRTIVPPRAPSPPPQPKEDPEEIRLREREEAIRKQREARAEKLKQLEREEEEAAHLEEERYQARLQALKSKSASPVVSQPAFTPTPYAPSTASKPPSPPPPPIAPQPPVVASPPTADKSHNPFSRLIKEGGSVTPPTTTPTTTTNGSTNPWAKSQTPSISSPPPPKSPIPSAIKTPYHTAPSSAVDEEWDDIEEKDDDDSSDDEITRSRETRANIAQALFGRPQSAAGGAAGPVTSPGSPGPMSAPPTTAPQPPIPPPPPAAPKVAQPTPAAAAPPGDVSALMRSIQGAGGLKLRPTKTVDKSAPPSTGRVLGDSGPPTHIAASLQPVSPPTVTYPESVPMDADTSSRANNRQSVDWFATRAADAGGATATPAVERMTSFAEEEEHEIDDHHASIPTIHIDEHQFVTPAIHVDEAANDSSDDLMADIDKSVEFRARTLYAYEGDGPSDLSFPENQLLVANPSKSGGDWWFGKLVGSGKSGLFPKTYIQVIDSVKAKALYSYTGTNADELSFNEGDTIQVIDTSEEEWWKAERDGLVYIVPAAYLEVAEDETTHVVPTEESTASGLNDRETESNREESTQIASEVHEISDEESDDEGDDSSSDYLSFESDNEVDPERTKAERAAREHERQLVLEAAGLIVETVGPPPPKEQRSKRRPAPAAPPRLQLPSLQDKALPPTPEPEPDPADHATRLDDAFDRYESFRNMQANANRMSVASVTSVESTNPPPSPSGRSSLSGVTLRDSESKTYSHFLNFLGRARSPVEPSEKRTTLNISAPIVNATTPEGPSRTNSPFGSSWASLVDKTALEGIPTSERRRQEAIFELINTEAAYVRDLQLIVEVFYSSLMPLLDPKEVTVVFANIEDLLLTNTSFLSSLEERQKECRLYIDHIGDVLKNHMANMGVYMEYCVNQTTAIKVLQSLRSSKPELAALLQRLRDNPDVRNLDLSSYLLAPMQRITRYPLLIKQILHYTEVDTEKQAMQNSIDIAEKLLEHINESIRDQEGFHTLKELSKHLWIGQSKINLTAPTRNMGPRRLLREGPLLKAKSGRKLHGFLCSDILVLTDDSLKTLYRMPIPLSDAQVKEVSGGRDDLTFQISRAYPRGGDSISLKATSARDCQLWMREVDAAIRRCQRAEERIRTRGKVQ